MLRALPVEETLTTLLAQEDTDGDRQITIHDDGPKRLELTDTDGQTYTVEGTYALSNLLQELAMTREAGQATLDLDPATLHENPVHRTSRLIRMRYWDGLTRCIDAEGLAQITVDTKGEGTDLDRRGRLYVPATDPDALAYYQQVVEENPALDLDVLALPSPITPEAVLKLNNAPGVLSLALARDADGQITGGLPFVVPGGRFNELYGWDSYFEALGLLADGRVDLARAMVDHFHYEIEHYGQILNANRSYYLTRSQPPFLTAMTWAVYDHLPEGEERDAWMRLAIGWAIYEYCSVWTSGKRLTDIGLSRYFAHGIGMPPETEVEQFDAVLRPFAERAGMSLADYRQAIRHRTIIEPELEAYFVHDRTVRESGHDTSYRLEERAAHLCTVDLNSLLYRYETDIARCIDDVFGGELTLISGVVEKAQDWRDRAAFRQQRMVDYMWNEERAQFYDYDFVKQEQTGFDAITNLWPLWAGIATEEQAARMIAEALPLYEAAGGLLATTADARGPISDDRPQRQWDYPFGWPPHQITLWHGLQRYGFHAEAQRLAYRWLYLLTRNAADYNGTIPEKYDVVRCTHQVFVEYGNVGTEFDYITAEGFGWMNASYQVGLQVLTDDQRTALEALTPPEDLFGEAPAR